MGTVEISSNSSTALPNMEDIIMLALPKRLMERAKKKSGNTPRYSGNDIDRYQIMPNTSATIEAGEEKSRKLNHQRKMLRRKMELYRVPLQQLKLNYSVSTTNKKVYTEEEDRFLACHA